MRFPTAVAATILLASAVPAAAQQPEARADLFGGYSMYRSEGESFHGLGASLGLSLGGPFSLVVDASRHTKTVEGADAKIEFLMGGGRLNFRGQNMNLFVQGLVGVARGSVGIDVLGVAIEESDTDLAGALGGGVDVRLTDSLALRAQADYTIIRVSEEGFQDAETVKDPRLSLGVVLRFGGR